jgi:hypothetical protein
MTHAITQPYLTQKVYTIETQLTLKLDTYNLRYTIRCIIIHIQLDTHNLKHS